MTFNLTAQAGSRRRSRGVTPRTFRVCPAPPRETSGAPSHILAKGLLSPKAIARVIEGTQRHCDVFARAMVSDLSPSSICPRGPLLETTRTLHDQKRLVSPARRCGNADLTLTGQRRYTDERFGLLSIAVGATSRSGDNEANKPPCNEAKNRCPFVVTNLGNPCAEKVLQNRPRQSFV